MDATSKSAPPSARVAAVALEKTYEERGVYDVLLGRSGDSSRVVWRLGPVSFELPPGGGLALIGRNGSGKSTLLRLLAGTSQPTAGQVRTVGRTGLLLDLGAGFIEEWSGEENARAALALSTRDGEASMESIRRFSELGRFLAEPVRQYSSGMRLRLAYAVAVAERPDVLITDEVLAVGDESFQRKCSRHIADYLASGGTLVLATHNLYLAEKLCDRAIWLEGGSVRALGPCREVTKLYRDSGSAERQAAAASSSAVLGRTGLELADAFEADSELRMEAWAEASAPSLEIANAAGTRVATLAPRTGGALLLKGSQLLPGSYRMRLLAEGAGGERVVHEWWCRVRGERRELGSVVLPHRWLPSKPGEETPPEPETNVVA